MGWLIALGVIVLLAILPLGASVRYDSEGVVARVIAGPVKFQIFPRPKKAKQEKKPKKNQAAPQNQEAQPAAEKPAKKKEELPPNPPEPKGGKITDFLPLVRVALDFLGDLRRKIRIDYLVLDLTMAADDPCDLAVNYGRANAAMSTVLAQLNRLFVIKNQDVKIQCDFMSDETRIIARLDLTITLGRIISLAVCYGIRALTTYLKIKKHQEGGANL